MQHECHIVRRRNTQQQSIPLATLVGNRTTCLGNCVWVDELSSRLVDDQSGPLCFY